MRFLIAVVVLLLTAPLAAVAADELPGGPGWYTLDIPVSVATTKGLLFINAGTPGKLVSYSADGMLMRIRFERGLASWLGAEINSATSADTAATLTIDVDPSLMRSLLKPVSKKTAPAAPPAPTPTTGGGAEPGALGAIAGTSGGVGAIARLASSARPRSSSMTP